MKEVQDRVVQFSNRYKLTDVATGEVLGTFDFDEVTGTVQQVGTEIDKELFDSIAADLAERVVSAGGELAGTIVTFSDISGTAANVASGDTSATLWGKVKNWFSRLKALAFKNKVAAGDFEAGAIKNADVAADAAIAQSKVSGLMTDYVASISASGRTVTYKNKNGVNMGSITTQDTTYGLASQSSNGLMSSTDKTKLDGIESGAQRNTVLGVKGSSESAYRTGNVNITKANIGLGNVDNTSDENKPVSTATQTALNGKANTSGSYPNMTVGNATHATNADNATNAVNADNATHADSADSAAKATQDGNGDNIAATYAKQNGTYPNMAAGEAKGLSKVGSVYADSASSVGWHKFAEVPLSALTAVAGASSYSAIVLVNGLNPYQGGDTANSGIVEVDMRVDGSRFASSMPPQIKLLSGNVDIQKLCFKRTDTEVGLYINTSSIYVRYSFTVLDERYYLGRSVDAMEFADEYYGAAAPDGAVYATNVNQAAYAQEAAMLDEAYKAGNNSSASQNGYVKLIDFTAGNNWAEKTLRLEFGDDNASNVPQNPCGMEIRVQWNSSVGVSPRAVLLYGDKQIADKLYVSYTPSFTEGEENTVSVYYKVSSGHDMVAYKPLYMTPRQGTDVTGVNFYQPTQSDLIAELPSGNTNTAITALENFRDLRYAKYDADGNDISDTYAKQSGTYTGMTVGNANKAIYDGGGNQISTTYLKVSDLLGYQQISQPTQVDTILRFGSVMFAFAQNGKTFKVHEHNAQFAIMFQIPTAGTIFIFYINNGAIAIDGNANSLQCELDPNGSILFYMTINPR